MSGSGWNCRLVLLCGAALLPAGCAAPPLTLYTLGEPTIAADLPAPRPPAIVPPAASPRTRGGAPSHKRSRSPSHALHGTPRASPPGAPIAAKLTVIEIGRVTVPDELDTEDIVVRDGSTLRRSIKGRWASRLSLGITDRLTARLAARRPDALVTDRPQTEAAAYRVQINFSRMDVTVAGNATLEADWLIVPHDPGRPARRDRARLSATGPVATDQDVVTLEGKLLDQLAGLIDIAGLR